MFTEPKFPEMCRLKNIPNRSKCLNVDPRTVYWWTDEMAVGRSVVDLSKNLYAGPFFLPSALGKVVWIKPH